jgi:hypothetical protein
MEKKLIRILSFSRKRESSKFIRLWTPVFTGVTTFFEFIKIVSLINNPQQWLLPGAKLR